MLQKRSRRYFYDSCQKSALNVWVKRREKLPMKWKDHTNERGKIKANGGRNEKENTLCLFWPLHSNCVSHTYAWCMYVFGITPWTTSIIVEKYVWKETKKAVVLEAVCWNLVSVQCNRRQLTGTIVNVGWFRSFINQKHFGSQEQQIVNKYSLFRCSHRKSLALILVKNIWSTQKNSN